VSFKIEIIRGSERTTVRAAGRLSAEAVTELLRAVPLEPSRLVVDLSEVQSVDLVAGRALQGLRERGARLVRATPYVALLLEATSALDRDQ